MADVLAKIVADKRIEIAQREHDFPLSEFIDQLKPSEKSFIAAVSKPTAGFIFECKKASPSKGLIRENFDLDEIVSAYEREAACFSVLTDEKYFQGRFEYLQYVTSRVSQPVLNKDFFVVPYQVYLARYYNADAVLLMLSVLDDNEYTALSELTYSLGMEVLTEVSNEQETHRALALGAKIIGINNRDLRDLSTDLATTERLVPLIRNSDFDGVIISESGIYTHQDLLRLNHLVDGYLVGSSLMAQDNLTQAVSQLAYGQVKICGITRTDHAQAIANTPASYMGLIFAPNSPRFVSLEQALSITQSVSFDYVGVFVDAPLEQVVDYVAKLGLSAVQLHGNESGEYISALRLALPNTCDIWQVISVTEGQSAGQTQERIEQCEAINGSDIALYLLDCKVGKVSGGTGQAFDWGIIDSLKDTNKVIIAGGITPQNAKQAMLTNSFGIDVNSGVESAPGEKELAKIHTMFSSLRI
ncbi:bifunctional indole-3-glycerol-phosphate synthase TrpC/phosphoribosylanthranilate isomerase TrpF [Glaciecola sp. XM2]|uniref:bifunctional indole-3-glycerol-phosphate synthase TrpC/phosphoribosylanthranilate isomerase TrpF n=1 Tax=Glaciecola sp. XM2 TaxID=1914931 RepID=UPI001BDE1E29|nr:bifunctional indole-3-glycerol-phosphate synthase TrpC/phosphoribosylanthranilate isomerase TrpF [Glaciecola sp. XM2]